MTAIEMELRKFGYVRDPNVATRWSPGGPGILECDYDVHVWQNRIEVLPKWWQRSLPPVALGTFYRPADFFTWLQEHGKPSEGGYRQPEWID